MCTEVHTQPRSRPTRPLSPCFVVQRSVSTSGYSIGVEATPESPGFDSNISLTVSCRLRGVGVSIIDEHPRELLYLTAGGVAVNYIREGQVFCTVQEFCRVCTTGAKAFNRRHLSTAVGTQYLLWRVPLCFFACVASTAAVMCSEGNTCATMN